MIRPSPVLTLRHAQLSMPQKAAEVFVRAQGQGDQQASRFEHPAIVGAGLGTKCISAYACPIVSWPIACRERGYPIADHIAASTMVFPGRAGCPLVQRRRTIEQHETFKEP
jgi:hypothetical protein